MKQIGDLLDKEFGKLTVKKFIGKDKYYNKIWECECECGNITHVRQGHLISGHTTSCGCNKNNLKSLVGKRFGNLVVEKRAVDYICPSNGKRYVQWECICDCKNRVTVIGNNLVSKSTISCGCMNPHKLNDLSKRQFGKLTVIKQVEPYVNPSGRKLIQYQCKCECGRYVNVLANTLRSGDTMSCGCSINSKGEKIVSDWLNKNNIEYELHKSFSDCLSDSDHRLNFDFYIPKMNTLIECNGIQHYEPIDFFGGQNQFESQLKHDEIKRLYAEDFKFNYLVLDCRKNKLKFIENSLSDFFNKH